MKCYVLNKEDKILVYINKDLDFASTKVILEKMQRNFPENQVIVIHNEFINSIDIIKAEDPYNRILNSYNQYLNNEDYK